MSMHIYSPLLILVGELWGFAISIALIGDGHRTLGDGHRTPDCIPEKITVMLIFAIYDMLKY
jgi:hypothetical protein